MKKYNDIMTFVVKALLVVLVFVLTIILIVSMIWGQGILEKTGGGTVSIGGIVFLMDRYMKYDTLTKATASVENLDAEVVKKLIESLKSKDAVI